MELELEKLNLPSDNERPFVIAGPCSAETEEQVMNTARQLAMKGCHNFRAGVWKPRTKPGGFEGNGEKALPWMKQVKEETHMLIATEVATPEHVELALKYDMDILWVVARTTANRFAGCRCACFREESCQSRPRTLDRRFAASEPGWREASGSYPSWFFFLRTENLPQCTDVADSH